MNEYFQTVTVSDKCCDEWIEYKGYSKNEAVAVRDYNNLKRTDTHYSSEVRSYRLPDDRAFEDLSDEEQCIVLSCYDIVNGIIARA